MVKLVKGEELSFDLLLAIVYIRITSVKCTCKYWVITCTVCNKDILNSKWRSTALLLSIRVIEDKSYCLQ